MSKNSSIPIWFKPENYARRYKLSLDEWHFELRQRWLFYETDFHEKRPDKINLALESHKPFCFLHKGHIVFKGIASLSEKYKKEQELYSTTLGFNNQLSRHEFSSQTSCYDFIDLRINLSMPDDILIEKFKQYLRCKRTTEQHSSTIKHNKLPTMSEADCDSWAYSGLLQYLDLTQWTKLEGTTISRKNLGIEIYGTDFDHGENELPDQTRGVSQTTLTHASQIYEIISNLNNQLYKLALIELPQD